MRALSPLRDFLHTEAAGGVLLVVASAAALVWANSPWSGSYESLWHSHIAIEVAGHSLDLDLRAWVNDGLMSLFFLIVGLEIKREVTTGHLAGRRAAALPVAAAIGGMAVPALIYLAIAGGTSAKGWGIPMATDIALAVGVMAIAGSAVPASLRAFLLGLAVVDDIGAILVIAIFYSSGVSFGWLAVGVVSVLVAMSARRMGVHAHMAYLTIGVVLWYSLHEAGVHPTLAGVVMGLLAPLSARLDPEYIDVGELTDVSSVARAQGTVDLARGSVSTVEWLEHMLHPWTSFVIVPVFALANAGIEVSTTSLRHAIDSPVTWGVFVGLLLGKPVGVLLMSKLAHGTGIADRPSDIGSRQLLGAGTAAGIGFTVAIFIAELAFRNEPADAAAAHIADAKMAILAASLLAGVAAYVILRAGRAVRDDPADARFTEPTKLS